MDILLNSSGDLYISETGDIALGNSVSQKIRIRLLWFEGEWRWDTGEGLPYFSDLFIKNPDTDAFESLIRTKIFEVEEVTDVKDVEVNFDGRTRKAVIKYTALTDSETIKDEVTLNAGLRGD